MKEVTGPATLATIILTWKLKRPLLKCHATPEESSAEILIIVEQINLQAFFESMDF